MWKSACCFRREQVVRDLGRISPGLSTLHSCKPAVIDCDGDRAEIAPLLEIVNDLPVEWQCQPWLNCWPNKPYPQCYRPRAKCTFAWLWLAHLVAKSVRLASVGLPSKEDCSMELHPPRLWDICRWSLPL